MKTRKILIILLAVSIVFLATWSGRKLITGSASPGLPSTVATTSIHAVSTTQSRVFATSSCASRIVTTGTGNVRLTFRDDYLPTATFGHLQVASTTVVYDGGLYGCDAVRAYGFTAENITITETR